jgi:RNA polymerase sigma-70 factor, ECF subfamily
LEEMMTLDVEDIWKKYRAKLLQFVKTRVGNMDDAEDITQDVFLKIFRNIDTLRSEDKLQSWLYQIARNAIADHFDSRKPMSELPDLPQIPEDSSTKALKDLAACLLPMIDELPPHYRESIMLSEMEGKPHKEISRTLGISPSGSKSRVQRGRALLKDMLLDCCKLEFDHEGRLFEYEKRGTPCDGCT